MLIALSWIFWGFIVTTFEMQACISNSTCSLAISKFEYLFKGMINGFLGFSSYWLIMSIIISVFVIWLLRNWWKK